MKIPVAAAMILAGSLAFTTGCATKKSVAKETAPLINKTNELDDLTAKTTRDIKDLDARATKGIADVNSKADAADQKAATARQAADAANELATKASTGVETLTNQVVNLDNYRPVAETAVHFGFNKADLTKKAKEALDAAAVLKRALRFWNNPELTPATHRQLLRFANRVVKDAGKQQWKQQQYPVMLETALRQLIAVSPDMQTA